MKKINLLILVIICLLSIGSCKKDGVTIINNVINQETSTTDIENIRSLEDALCNATMLAKGCVVGVISSNSLALVKQEKTGSGVVVAKTNDSYYIITNRHVVSNSSNKINDQVSIYLGEINVTIDAKVVNYDHKKDLALLKVDTKIAIGVAKISETDLRCGQYVIAVGSPYDLNNFYNTVTVGHLSSSERKIIEKDINNQDVTNIYLQHDATINVGNSGGGLFNINGELIGINTWKLDSDEAKDMNFAIPAVYIKALLSDI